MHQHDATWGRQGGRRKLQDCVQSSARVVWYGHICHVAMASVRQHRRRRQLGRLARLLWGLALVPGEAQYGAWCVRGSGNSIALAAAGSQQTASCMS